MKRITLFLTMCFGLSVFQTVFADDAETVRAASKRVSVNNISSTNSSTRTLVSNPKQKSEQNRTENARSANTGKTVRNSATVQSRTAAQPAVKQRSATKPVTTKTVTTRSHNVVKNTKQSRTAVARQRSNQKIKATTRSAISPTRKQTVGRMAVLNDAKIEAIKNKDYSKCKTVYHECMDEFCANKDTTLRRCACSSRIHEFDNIKQQLNDASEKMIGFNQRLLTVGLDKEDAKAINVATEGEKAFSIKDTSESEKLLQKINDTLNSSSDSKISNNLSAISLDLDMESAWDTVDATSGIATTAKSGLGLYNAALPVCLEMAKEVCSNDELEIAENSYKLAIQQDCNTVSKAYSTQYTTAINKIHESGALLDMARLNAYQERNSDDILTCKRKILEQLYDDSVCGEKLYKCLDITGQYIDPSNGSAFLSSNLYNLTTLLTAPSGDIKWSKMAENQAFVDFLNSKKMFLKTATDQCRDIADYVWSDFLEDALAQIKLAQNAKLEEIKRSCVTLIAECKTNALTNLENFDVRATSTFSILADVTASGMCADIQNSCIGLLDKSIGDEGTWSAGLTGLNADIAYEKILNNCLAVGQTCVMQKCNGTAGNFALCDTQIKPIRQSLLRTEICWNEIEQCVNQFADLDSLSIPAAPTNGYNIHPCADNSKSCLVTHKIWGDCMNPLSSTDSGTGNKIQTEDSYTDSLLAWFANKTSASCNVSECNTGYMKPCGICAKIISSDNILALPSDVVGSTLTTNDIIYVNNDIINYCSNTDCKHKDKYGNCCVESTKDLTTGICVPDNKKAVLVQTVTCPANSGDKYYCADNKQKTIDLYCITDDNPNTYPTIDDDNIVCGDDNAGKWLLVDSFGNYFNPAITTTTGEGDSQTTTHTSIYETPYPTMSFTQSTHCTTIPCVIPQFTFEFCNETWKHVNTAIGDQTCEDNGVENTDFGPANGSLSNKFTITY